MFTSNSFYFCSKVVLQISSKQVWLTFERLLTHTESINPDRIKLTGNVNLVSTNQLLSTSLCNQGVEDFRLQQPQKLVLPQALSLFILMWRQIVRSKINFRHNHSQLRKKALQSGQIHKDSIQNPDVFWKQAALNIDWEVPFGKVLSDNVPHGRWFEGGKMNTAYNCIDRHILNGHGSSLAIVHDSPVTESITKLTYDELFEKTVQLACVLRNLGVKKGDRVVIYMPNMPEAVISMLACARIGAVHSVVFGGFADVELAARIKDCQPKIVIASSCGIENNKVLDYKKLLDSALDIASTEHKVQNCLILQRKAYTASLLSDRDLDMQKSMDEQAKLTHKERTNYEILDASDPLYILYTSGTTGKPKGVLRDNGGHAVALQWAMENIYNVQKGDVFWAAR